MNPFSKKLFKELFFLLSIVAITNYVALQHDLYYKLNEFDSLVHYTAGIACGIGFIFFYYFSGLFKPSEKNFFGFLYMALVGTLFIGLAWEIFELVSGATSLVDPGYYSDTFLDLVMDELGALTACLYAFSREVSIEKKELKKKESHFYDEA